MSSQFRIEDFPAYSEIYALLFRLAVLDSSNIQQNNVNSIPLRDTVQPVPAPFSTNALASSRIREGGSSQNEILFNRGKAINNIISRPFKPTFHISQCGLDCVILLSNQVGRSCRDYCIFAHSLIVEPFYIINSI